VRSVIVGYLDTPAGRDALALGAALAATLGLRLDLVLVLHDEGRASLVPVGPSYERHLDDLAEGWLKEARAGLPESVASTAHVVRAETFAEGLVTAAGELGADGIVIGAGKEGAFGRLHLGSVGGVLVHSAPVPVAIAPAGFAGRGVLRFGTITAAVGTRAGARAVVDSAIAVASAARVPLRLVSLVPLDVADGTGSVDTRDRADDRHAVAREHAEGLRDVALRTVPDRVDVTVEIAPGPRIGDAIRDLTWTDDELAFVGSSRLAQPHRLFLGSVAAKIVRGVPVPLVVVPRDHDPRSTRPDPGSDGVVHEGTTP
jgi:nucleotide-binding universal stress UspA family protein